MEKVSNEEDEGDCKKIKVASPQDISSFWKCRDEDLCHGCDLKSENVITLNVIKCLHCLRFDNTNCFHKPVGDHAYMQSLKSKLRTLLARREILRKYLKAIKQKKCCKVVLFFLV